MNRVVPGCENRRLPTGTPVGLLLVVVLTLFTGATAAWAPVLLDTSQVWAQDNQEEGSISLADISSPRDISQPVPIKITVVPGSETVGETLTISAWVTSRVDRDVQVPISMTRSLEGAGISFVGTFTPTGQEGAYDLHATVAAEGAPVLISEDWPDAFAVYPVPEMGRPVVSPESRVGEPVIVTVSISHSERIVAGIQPQARFKPAGRTGFVVIDLKADDTGSASFSGSSRLLTEPGKYQLVIWLPPVPSIDGLEFQTESEAVEVALLPARNAVLKTGWPLFVAVPIILLSAGTGWVAWRARTAKWQSEIAQAERQAHTKDREAGSARNTAEAWRHEVGKLEQERNWWQKKAGKADQERRKAEKERRDWEEKSKNAEREREKAEQASKHLKEKAENAERQRIDSQRKARQADQAEKGALRRAKWFQLELNKRRSMPLFAQIRVDTAQSLELIRTEERYKLDRKMPQLLANAVGLSVAGKATLEQIVRELASRFLADAGQQVEVGLKDVDDLRLGKALTHRPEFTKQSEGFHQEKDQVDGGIAEALFKYLEDHKNEIFALIYRFIQSGYVDAIGFKAMYLHAKGSGDADVVDVCAVYSDLLRLNDIVKGGEENRILVQTILDAAKNRFALLRRYRYGEGVFSLYMYLYRCIRINPTHSGFTVPKLDECVPEDMRKEALEPAEQQSPSRWPVHFNRVIAILKDIEGHSLVDMPFDEIRRVLSHATEVVLESRRDSPEKEVLEAILECWIQSIVATKLAGQTWPTAFEKEILVFLTAKAADIAHELAREVPQDLLDQWKSEMANQLSRLPRRLLFSDSPELQRLPGEVATALQPIWQQQFGEAFHEVVKAQTNGVLKGELEEMRKKMSEDFTADLKCEVLGPLPSHRPVDVVFLIRNEGSEPARQVELTVLPSHRHDYDLVGEQKAQIDIIWPVKDSVQGLKKVEVRFRLILRPGTLERRRIPINASLSYQDQWNKVQGQPVKDIRVACFDWALCVPPRELKSQLFTKKPLPLDTLRTISAVLAAVKKKGESRRKVKWQHFLHPLVLQRWDELAGNDPYLVQLIGRELFSWWQTWAGSEAPGYLEVDTFEDVVLGRIYCTSAVDFWQRLEALEQLALAGLLGTKRWSVSVTKTSIAITLGVRIASFRGQNERGDDCSLDSVLNRLCQKGVIEKLYGGYRLRDFLSRWLESEGNWSLVDNILAHGQLSVADPGQGD